MVKGTQSTRTIRKSNPFSGGRSGHPASEKPQMETLNTPRRKEPPRIRTGPSLNQDSLSRKVSLSSKTENRTFYNNPVSVRQWAAETDTNAPVDFTEHGLLDSTYGADATVFCDAAQHPGPLPISCSSASPVSFPVTSGFQGDDLSAACTYPDHNGMARSLGDALGLETYSGCDFTKNYETWSYPTQTVEDITYSTSTISCLPFGGDSTTEPRFPDWSMTFFPTDNETSREDFSCGSQSLGWSPMLATDPSVSSSFSRSSYLALQANTPLSPVAQEPDWPTDLTTCQEETVFYPAFSLGEPSHPPGYSTGHQDPMSTLKPSRPFQRALVSGMDLWTPEDSQLPPYPGPTAVDFTQARRLSDGESTTTAREHPLYQVGPKEDGLYYCPFAGSEDCSHKPEKLKCNYDKHLDSHLKPYRCKLSTCSTLAFSSTACLLRHEREAHGMHGHGDKPHLCIYRECERAIQGNGFPRRWNLFDHMRRVHGYTGSASPPGSTSPTPSSAGSFCQGQATLAIRKRRTSSPPKAEPMKKTKSNTSNKPVASAASRGRQRQSMQMVFQQHKAAINARMATLDPTNNLAMEQLNADYAMLRTMAVNIQSQNTTHSAY